MDTTHIEVIHERKCELEIAGRTLIIEARMGASRVWFSSPESQDRAWIVTEGEEPGHILALRATLV